MSKNTEKLESDELTKRLQDILQLRTEWLDLLKRAALERAGDEPEFPAEWEAQVVCDHAIQEWRRLSHDLFGWVLAAGTGTFSNRDKPSMHARRARLIGHLRAATFDSPDRDTYVIVALPKELAREVESALEKLEYGEVDPILEPAKRKNYKDGWTIPRYRERIVCACHYCYGATAPASRWQWRGGVSPIL
jgi:hypothetical protein